MLGDGNGCGRAKRGCGGVGRGFTDGFGFGFCVCYAFVGSRGIGGAVGLASTEVGAYAKQGKGGAVMRRLLLTLRYDGTAYHGWQVQPNAQTIQETLQDAILALTGVRSGVIGCSRTDTGVHADMVCCTFDTESTLPAERVPLALNMHLPEDIAVYGCQEVALDFLVAL